MSDTFCYPKTNDFITNDQTNNIDLDKSAEMNLKEINQPDINNFSFETDFTNELLNNPISPKDTNQLSFSCMSEKGYTMKTKNTIMLPSQKPLEKENKSLNTNYSTDNKIRINRENKKKLQMITRSDTINSKNIMISKNVNKNINQSNIPKNGLKDNNRVINTKDNIIDEIIKKYEQRKEQKTKFNIIKTSSKKKEKVKNINRIKQKPIKDIEKTDNYYLTLKRTTQKEYKANEFLKMKSKFQQKRNQRSTGLLCITKKEKLRTLSNKNTEIVKTTLVNRQIDESNLGIKYLDY